MVEKYLNKDLIGSIKIVFKSFVTITSKMIKEFQSESNRISMIRFSTNQIAKIEKLLR